MPPNAPASTLAIIIIIEYVDNSKFLVTMLDIKYIKKIYIIPNYATI